MKSVLPLVERGLVPDRLIRRGIRSLLRQRIDRETNAAESLSDFARKMTTQPVAVSTEKANEQHYEVPAAFYDLVLGPQRKYSSAYWPPGVNTLAEAEKAMLALTCERAELVDGQTILELGCGWGSLTLWMGEHYPESQILAVSNSHSQREYILAQAEAKGLTNISVETADMNDFSTPRVFDRVVSIEMFEHMRNHALLLERISCVHHSTGVSPPKASFPR